MIELELKDITYNLPTNFSEINIDTYQKISEIDEELKDIDKTIKIISILSSIDEDDVKSINIEQLKIIRNNISFIFKNEKLPLVDRFVIDGVKYGYNNNSTSTSFGEFIDLEEYSKPKEINKNLHILMAILYRPVKNFKKRNLFSYFKKEEDNYDVEEYNSDDVMDRAELFKEKLTMDKVLGAMVFFSLIRISSTLHMKGYSQQNIKKKMKKLMKNMMIQEELLYG